MKRLFYVLLIVVIVALGYFFVWPQLKTRFFPSATTTTVAAASTQAQGRRGAPPAAVIVATASKQTIPILKTAVGFMEAVDQVVVRARASGMVVEVKVAEGQTVKAGDPLFQLDDAPIQVLIARDQATIARDQATADFQAAELARAKMLTGQGNDTKEQLQTAQSTADAASAVVAIDKAQLAADQLTLSYMTVVAPIDGRVGVLNASKGDTVSSADTSVGGLLTITNPAKLRVSFAVAERQLDDFRKVMSEQTPTPVQIMVSGDKTPRATGTLSFIDSTIDTASGSFLVKADVDNTSLALWPGQYVTVSVQTGAYTDAITVPTTAVQQGSAGPYVFSVSSAGLVKQVPITLTDTINNAAIVASGLTLGDKVVVEGQLGLSDGATVVATDQAAPASKAPPAATATPPMTTLSPAR